MPNWVHNRVEISGDPKVVKELITFVANEEREFDFIKFFAPANKAEYEGGGWYDWNIENWGTKWNACEVSREISYLESHNETYAVTYNFDTAWSPPEPIIQRLITFCEQLNLSLNWHYLEEQGWGGCITLIDGFVQGEETWDIPSSHEEYEKYVGECYCEVYDDERPFPDCPKVLSA